MGDTRERILLAALRLFARDGFEAASVSAIAGELGMTKSALYRHFESKRDIFDSIVRRMEQLDRARAGEYGVPEDEYTSSPEEYAEATPGSVGEFAKAQFRMWTEDELAASFRRLITLEQYRSAEGARLYGQYLAAGPLGYMEDIFAAMLGESERAGALALEFYAPLYLLYSVYDESEDKAAVAVRAREYIDKFIEKLNDILEENNNELSAE